MKILLLESFYASSHKQWADGLISNSSFEITLLSLPGRHWKWRMHHAGKYFAYETASLKAKFDMILCSDMMNVAEFRGLLSSIGTKESWFNNVPIITYFHENQITYPWSENDPDPELKRDNHYGWINYLSCLSSDYVLFNSDFHRDSFIEALPSFIKQFPHVPQDDFIDDIKAKSKSIPVGLNLHELYSKVKTSNKRPIILWNHRWEFDKNPEQFFETLIGLRTQKLEFDLIIAGEKYKNYPEIFDKAKTVLSERIIHFGFIDDRSQYRELLIQSDILPVTSNQDFFGISVIEAIAAGCTPLLPNRLAFPEHLDKPEFQKYYYNNQEEFVSKLSSFIESNESSYELRKHIMKYDQKNIAPKYDDVFKALNSLKAT